MATIMRAYMHYDVRPNDWWTTNMEFDYAGSLSAGEVESAALDFANGLANLLLNNVVIDRVTVSTWQEDSEPYDPANLVVIPIGINGEIAFLFTAPVDDDIVLFIRKTVTTGRSGKILLRGALTVAMIDVNSGSWFIVPIALDDIQDRVAELWLGLSNQFNPILIGRSLLETILPATPAGQKQVPIKVYTTVPVERNVVGLVAAGVTERQDTQ